MKATYYYNNGNRQLVGVPCTADKDGNLTRPGESEPFVTGCTCAAEDGKRSGVYVLDDATAAPAKPKKGSAKAVAETPAAEPAAEELPPGPGDLIPDKDTGGALES